MGCQGGVDSVSAPYRLCEHCGQPMLPEGEVKKPNEYDHAHGCPDEPAAMAKRNPLDLSTWGSECARGVPYKNVGPTTDGAKNQRRSISSGRKTRGNALSDFEKQEARKAE